METVSDSLVTLSPSPPQNGKALFLLHWKEQEEDVSLLFEFAEIWLSVNLQRAAILTRRTIKSAARSWKNGILRVSERARAHNIAPNFLNESLDRKAPYHNSCQRRFAMLPANQSINSRSEIST